MKKVLWFLFSVIILNGCKGDKEVTSPQPGDLMNKSDYLVKVDKTPMPIGGIEVIQNNVVYPSEAKDKGIEGKVFVLMYIDEGGNLTSAEVIKSIHYLLDKAALDAVKDVKFTPGIYEGEAVKTQVAVPIVFKLDREGKKQNTELKKEGDYYTEADEMPQIAGGPVALMEKVVYPKAEKEKGTQGDVIVSVFVNENGEPVKAEVVKSLNENMDKAALDAVKAVKYTPGKIDGKNVKMKIYIPIKFKLR
jgi:TonB family protein